MGLRFDSRKPSLPLLESREEVLAYQKLSGRADGIYRSFAERALALADRAEGDMLEIGPGPGRYLATFARLAPTWRVTGLDVSEPMLAAARDYLESEGMLQRVELVQGDASAAPFPDSSFDLISATNILHHVHDPSAFFGEIARLLRPGGVAVIQSWNRGLNPVLAAGARLHTLFYTLTGNALGGGAVVLGSSFTVQELEAIIRGCEGVSCDVTGGTGFSLSAVIRKFPVASTSAGSAVQPRIPADDTPPAKHAQG